MARKSDKKILFRWGDPIKHRHRHTKVDYVRLLRYLGKSALDSLYYLGASAERVNRNLWRYVRKALRAVIDVVELVFNSTIGALLRVLVEFIKDLLAPFAKLIESIYSYSVVMDDPRTRDPHYKRLRRQQFLRYGWMWNKHLISRMVNNLLPLAALLVCAYVINTMINLNYALAVTYNGQTLGYVADEHAYDSAQRILRNRIIQTDEAEAWSADATLSLAVVPETEVSSEDMMADSLLSVSGTEIAQATGLYIGGVFYGATTATDLLQSAVDAVIQPYRDAAASQSNTNVRFVRSVELVDGIYPESSVLTFEDMEKVVNSTDESDIYYTASVGETALEIASKNGLTVERLSELNPGTSMELEGGERLLVALGEPLLSVKTVTVETTREPVEYDIIEIKDPRLSSAWFQVIIPGVNGEKIVTTEIEYMDGEEVSRTVVNEEITREPVPEEIIRGTKDDSGELITSGRLAWPVPNYQRVSRGWSAGHKAIDIAAAQGMPIYAADTGTVTTSGWSNAGYGYYVVIDHGKGFETLYAHCSRLLCSAGDMVAQGDLIALIGSTGNSTGPHCHFEVRVDGTRVPTEPYLYG